MKYHARAVALRSLSGWPTLGPPRGGWRRDDPATGQPHPNPPAGGGTGDTGTSGKPAGDGEPGTKPKLDGDYDPERALADLGKARDDAKREREMRQKLEQEGKDKLDAVLVALGLKPDPQTDPAATAAKVAKELTDAQAENRELRAENAVLKHAPKLGADAAALQDSREFAKKLAELDPTASDYAKSVASLIKDAVKDNPTRYAATGASGGQGPARQGAEHGGGTTRTGRPQGLGAALATRLGGGQ
ncbi:hypothetical protein [Virgisporangium ochraceum]|uniref:Scaffolding protein n=1 Tax=Virgisporangium ochraceum TaxID=65505 RepID=A0A8J3ZLV2_9ACTN|nr:hypothetical protein [Virgisporangium ochraceum]GIJ66254.1 hypothetical protein Voc01_011710 [Virgisporangium ochraceum]